MNKYRQRNGITLLFVVSMIVLFLLMGTTFVVVSNDYLRASKKRARVDIHTVDGTAVLERALYDVIRGPNLANSTSPLRGQDLLSDMYGYGFRARINGTPTSVTGSNGQLIELELQSETGMANQVLDLRSNTVGPLSDKTSFYTSHVFTFVSGPASGVSTRVVDYVVTIGSPNTHKFRIVLNWSDNGGITPANLTNSLVVVNGRAFGGFGAGGFNTSALEGTAALGVNALSPNRIGENRATITGSSGYLADYLGPNESYDAPDFQNMFLSGYDSAGKILPSFFRESIGNTSAPGGPANRGSFAAFADPYAASKPERQVDNDNDGIPDSIWTDIGAQVQSNGQGLFYKPLVAYHIVDMGGRLNLNTVGNLVDRADTSARPVYAGQGYGPADISLTTFLGDADYLKILQGDGTYPGRYGFGTTAGSGRTGRDNWSIQKLFGYPVGVNKVGGFYQSAPMDIRGRFPTSTPTAVVFPDPNLGMNNNLPVFDFTNHSTTLDVVEDSPYESNFAPSPFNKWDANDDDVPFTTAELERWLRPSDVDSQLLSDRLTKLASTIVNNSTKRIGVTTDSYEVPMAPFLAVHSSGKTSSLLDIFWEKLKTAGLTDAQINQEISSGMLPFELLRGMKLDVNRPFGNGRDDNGNQVIDDPNEFASTQKNLDLASTPNMDLNNDYAPGSNDDLARYLFAKHLYVLTLLVTEDSNTSFANVLEYRKAIAQWAINVVDFRDADSINTPFEFDLNPWNGWDTSGSDGIDGRVLAGEPPSPSYGPGDRWVVWGTERPELLITETFAHHDRRNEDLKSDDGDNDDTASGNDDDYDSRLVPQTSTFIELYNPWTQDATNQNLPAELVDNPTMPTGIDLQKKSPGGSPVWRIGVRRDPTANTFLRSIYFVNVATPTADPDDGEEFYSSLTNIPPVARGRSAVIGSSGNIPAAGSVYRTTFGRIQGATDNPPNLQLNLTRSISLEPSTNPNAFQIVRNEWDGATTMSTSSTAGVAVVIDSPRSLSLSDPAGGYNLDPLLGMEVGDGFAYTAAFDQPLDDSVDPLDERAIWNNGVTQQFRTLYLQRLANPLQDWNAETNPYLTIDVSAIDLLAFNGIENNPNNGAPTTQESADANHNINDNVTDFHSLERGESQTTDTRQLFARDSGGTLSEPATPLTDLHNFSYEFVESFGKINDAYVSNGPANAFAWLTWNNRPFVSQLELANVPFAAPEHLTETFSLRNQTTMADPYTTVNPRTSTDTTLDPVLKLGGQFGHLLNFHGHDESSTPAIGNFYRLFDYTEVPSRYIGTEMWLNPSDFTNHPFNFISHYRYPGKINLNTIPNQDVFDALMDTYNTKLTWPNFNASRWNGNHFRPYRNSSEGNLVPATTPSLVEENVECGLFRRDTSGTNSLFDLDDTAAIYNTDRSAYFRNQMRQRLGNLVTTRSSVFAIWITVGYFETNPDGSLKTNAGQGFEIGADTGEIKRNRGFYIFDRSIPVAFEPGKNHNVDRAIVVRTIIE